MGDGLAAPISGDGLLSRLCGGSQGEIHRIDRSLTLGGEREKQNQSMNLLTCVCVCAYVCVHAWERDTERERERERTESVKGREEERRRRREEKKRFVALLHTVSPEELFWVRETISLLRNFIILPQCLCVWVCLCVSACVWVCTQTPCVCVQVW